MTSLIHEGLKLHQIDCSSFFSWMHELQFINVVYEPTIFQGYNVKVTWISICSENTQIERDHNISSFLPKDNRFLAHMPSSNHQLTSIAGKNPRNKINCNSWKPQCLSQRLFVFFFFYTVHSGAKIFFWLKKLLYYFSFLVYLLQRTCTKRWYIVHNTVY